MTKDTGLSFKEFQIKDGWRLDGSEKLVEAIDQDER